MQYTPTPSLNEGPKCVVKQRPFALLHHLRERENEPADGSLPEKFMPILVWLTLVGLWLWLVNQPASTCSVQ